LNAQKHHLEYIKYIWNNPSEDYIIGRHTDIICSKIDKAIELYRQRISSFLVITVPFRHGKALQVDVPILTIDGWKRHGDLNYGDFVFGSDGSPHLVIANTGAYEWNTVKVVFNHGEEIVCAREHLWKIKQFIDNRKGRKKIKIGLEYIESVLETQEIAITTKRRKRPPFIEIANTLKMPVAALPINPYILGVWLGDGNSANNYITKNKDDILFLNSKIKPFYPKSEIKHERYDGDNYRLLISGLLVELKQNNLLKNKHIPSCYLLASEYQRWCLVQGLMDTDGTVDKRGLCEFTQKDKSLACDFLFLIRSLGIRATIGEYNAKYQGKIIGKKYRVCFTPKRNMPVFTMPRKLERIQNKLKPDDIEKDRFYIKSIETYGKNIVNCIQVEGGIYLAGRELLPTHNSEIISRKLPSHFLGLFPDDNVLLSGHTASLVESMSRSARDIISTPMYQELFSGIMVNYTSSSVRNWRLRNHNGGCFAGALLSSIAGQGYNLGILDDFCGSREDAESQNSRDKMWEGFTDNFMTRRAPISITIILATRWHVDDIIGRIEKEMEENENFPRFEIVVLPAFSDEYESGVLFPERFSKSWYEEQRATLGEYGTAALLQCNPIIKGGNFLNIEFIQRHKSLDEYPDISYYRIWDLAHTAAERTKADPDYTSGTLMGIEKRGEIPHLWIKDVKRFRKDAPSRDEEIIRIAEEDGPYTKIGVENTIDAKDAVGTLKKILNGRRIVIPIEISRDKIIRAYPLESIFKAGNVHVIENEPWLYEWVSEIAAFPNGKHDDQVDNLSAGYAILGELRTFDDEFREQMAARRKRDD
jgi:predicted phage terminase large subunit-like protein